MNQELSSAQLADLRAQRLIEESEFAYIAGDLLIAENAVTNEKRIVGKSELLTENKRRVLKG
tara:strand:+ start:132 stop:317 length:186 start_codon:yes stop_codon:yes gene_type:complete